MEKLTGDYIELLMPSGKKTANEIKRDLRDNNNKRKEENRNKLMRKRRKAV